MPLEFLLHVACSTLPLVITHPVEIGLLQDCEAKGYLQVAPLAIRGGTTPMMVAARVLAILPKGQEALHALQEAPHAVA